MGCILKGGGGLHPRMRVGAVLLAAGEGRRMGGVVKPAIRLQGVPLINRALFALSGAGVDEVAVVLGHGAERLSPLVEAFPVTVVRNDRWQEGQAGSVCAGLEALRGPFDAVVVCLADQPLLNAQDVTALIAAYKKRSHGSIVVPTWKGRRGNPVIFDWAERDAVLGGEARLGCRHLIDSAPERVVAFEAPNDHFVIDLDTPDDLDALQRRLGMPLQMPAAAAAA